MIRNSQRTTIERVLAVLLLSILSTVSTPLLAQASMACRESFTVFDDGATPIGHFDGLTKLTQAPIFKSPARMVLTRFAAHKNFHEGTSQSWTSNGAHFIAGQAKATLQVGFSKNESLYASQQDFSLGKMVETGYLTPEQARLFRQDGLEREPGQVSFLEIVHDATAEEIKSLYGSNPNLRVGGYQTQKHIEGLTPIKTAALYSVAGQVWSETGKMKTLSLPWEKEESRKGQQLDRSAKVKYVWEWGRAGQDAAGEIAPLYAANALLNYVDLKAHGGSLDHAYVMVHSFDKVNTRLYSRMHPDSRYPKGGVDNPQDALFLVPLREALEKYKPSSVSEPLAKILELAGGRMTELQALDLLIEARQWRWSELDYQNYQGIQQAGPIIMNDLSNARSGLILLALKSYGLERPAAEAITDHLLGISNLLHTANTAGKYDHAADSLATSYQYLHRFNGVEISNLDPAMAKKDPYYAGSVLMSAFTQYARNMAQAIMKAHGLTYEQSYVHALQSLTEGPVTFGMTTHSPEVEVQIKKLQPSQQSVQKATVVIGAKPSAEEISGRPYRYRDSRIYIFTAKEVRKLITLHPDFYQAAGAGLYYGRWRAHYLLSQPDLF